MPYFLVGDDAFPLKAYMIRPYSRKTPGLHTVLLEQRTTLTRKAGLLMEVGEQKTTEALHCVPCQTQAATQPGSAGLKGPGVPGGLDD
ncbi:hypothetical protein V5799_010691 [Amblyomma americanum]|uniref:DDE Tnp4 domain-containing protein n=1 Tax=Amblyomma americanum TaxID=6943 RepID=A0AAQ4EIZ8_AMBAM